MSITFIFLSEVGFALGELLSPDCFWSDFMYYVSYIYIWIVILSLVYLFYAHFFIIFISTDEKYLDYPYDDGRIFYGDPTPVFRFLTFINCLFVLLCLIVWYFGGHSMVRVQQILEFFTSNVVTVIAVITAITVAFCALLTNISTYAASKKYNIPFRLIER